MVSMVSTMHSMMTKEEFDLEYLMLLERLQAVQPSSHT